MVMDDYSAPKLWRNMRKQLCHLAGGGRGFAHMQVIDPGGQDLFDGSRLVAEKLRLGDYYQLHKWNQAFSPARRRMMRSATFLPDSNIPPKIGPMRGVPDTAEAAMPHT